MLVQIFVKRLAYNPGLSSVQSNYSEGGRGTQKNFMTSKEKKMLRPIRNLKQRGWLFISMPENFLLFIPNGKRFRFMCSEEFQEFQVIRQHVVENSWEFTMARQIMFTNQVYEIMICISYIVFFLLVIPSVWLSRCTDPHSPFPSIVYPLSALSSRQRSPQLLQNVTEALFAQWLARSITGAMSVSSYTGETSVLGITAFESKFQIIGSVQNRSIYMVYIQVYFVCFRPRSYIYRFRTFRS